MSRRIAWHFALGCLLGATQALAADHLAGSVDLQFYPYTCEVDSHAAWDFDPSPFTDPPPYVVFISGSHQISNVMGVSVFSHSGSTSYIIGRAASEQCYTASLELGSLLCCTSLIGQADVPYAGPSGRWDYYLCSPPSPGDTNDDGSGYGSPIVVSLENRVRDDIHSFPLSGPKDPVLFDLAGLGNAQEFTWTKKNARVGFLSLDRNGDGKITTGAEFFGNYTPMVNGQPAPANSNGFFALRGYDSPPYGGNGDGHIGPEDAIWPRLRIWIDKDHDGVSQADEIDTLQECGIVEIGLDYALTSERDNYGNLFRYKSSVVVLQDSAFERVPAYDVFFQRVN